MSKPMAQGLRLLGLHLLGSCKERWSTSCQSRSLVGRHATGSRDAPPGYASLEARSFPGRCGGQARGLKGLRGLDEDGNPSLTGVVRARLWWHGAVPSSRETPSQACQRSPTSRDGSAISSAEDEPRNRRVRHIASPRRQPHGTASQGILALAPQKQKPPARRWKGTGGHGTESLRAYTLNELPQPQVVFTLGFSNLKPAPSRVST